MGRIPNRHLLLIIYLLQKLHIVICDGFTNESELLRHLTTNYHPGARPTRRMHDTLTVSIKHSVRKVQDLDEKQQILRADVNVVLIWTDDGLTWDAQGGLGMFSVPTEYIWTPMFEIMNGAGGQQKYFPGKGHLARVNSDGRVTLIVSDQLQTSCQVDLTYFPFDTQTCPIRIFSTFPTSYINITTADFPLDELYSYIPTSEWSDVKSNLEMIYNEYENHGDVEEGHPVATVNIKMCRSPSFYVIYLIIPALITSAVAVLAFALPPESGERVSLSITALLSYTVFLLMVSDVTPLGGQRIPVIVYYITWMEMLAAMEIAMNIMVLNVFHTERSTPMSNTFELWVLKRIARVVCIKVPRQSPTSATKIAPVMPMEESDSSVAASDAEPKTDVQRDDEEENKWILAAKVLDRLIVTCFIILFLTPTCFCLLLFNVR